MRFFVSGINPKNRPLYLAVGFFLFFMLLFWISNIIQFYLKFEFSVHKIQEYFFGTEEFPTEVSLSEALETTHFQLFVNAMLLIVFSSLTLLSRISKLGKVALICASFILGLFHSCAPYLLYLTGKEGCLLYLLLFISFHTSLIAMLLVSIFKMMKGSGDSKKKENKPEHKQRGVLVKGFSFFNLLFVSVFVLVFIQKMGFTPSSILQYYYGNEDLFIPAKSIAGVLEIALYHFFSMAVYLLCLTHFIGFTSFPHKSVLTALPFLFALLDVVSGFFLVQKVEWFSLVKLLSAGALATSLIFISLVMITEKQAVTPR